jgi:hypothetical protein
VPFGRSRSALEQEQRAWDTHRGLKIMAGTPWRQQQGVINPFRNKGGKGMLLGYGRDGFLAYTGDVVAGKAEGRGTVRYKGWAAWDGWGIGIWTGGWTIRGAEFRGGAMLPCSAVFAYDDGRDAFAGTLTASGEPADMAFGAVVRGADGGRFQGTWPAYGWRNEWFCPLQGAALVAADRSVHAVVLDGKTGIASGCSGWRPGRQGWARVGAFATSVRQVCKIPSVLPTAQTPSNRC